MITIELTYIVNSSEEGFKVSKILLNKLNVSVRLLNKLKMNEKILVNDRPVFSNYVVHENDIIIVKIDFIETDNIIPQKIDLDILYEDEYFLAINKPSNMVVHPSANHHTDTLANGVKYYLNNNKKIRAINRLDKDTTGIVLFAKNEYIQELMINNKIKKEYLAITDGIIFPKEGIINKPIARKPGSVMKRIISEEGQIAKTHYHVIKELDNKYSLVSLILETGRTHQIRVHLQSIGAPILGDSLYGNTSKIASRQLLHAYKMTFTHPINKKEIQITTPDIPKDMIVFIEKY